MIGLDDEREYEVVAVIARARGRGEAWENTNLITSGRRFSYELTIQGAGGTGTRSGVVYSNHEIRDGDKVRVTPRVRAPGIANRTINLARRVTAADVIAGRRSACG